MKISTYDVAKYFPGQIWPIYEAVPDDWTGGPIDVVIFFHGTVQRIPENKNDPSWKFKGRWDVLVGDGIPKLLLAGRNYKFAVVAPQTSNAWDIGHLHALVNFVKAKFGGKVILTGLSLGAAPCYDYAAAFPEDIAAILPISVCADWATTADPTKLQGTKVIAAHGTADSVGSWSCETRRLAAINNVPLVSKPSTNTLIIFDEKDEVTSPVSFTSELVINCSTYPVLISFANAGHNVWTDLYASDLLAKLVEHVSTPVPEVKPGTFTMTQECYDNLHKVLEENHGIVLSLDETLTTLIDRVQSNNALIAKVINGITG